MEGYYCSKCNKYVLTRVGWFTHPHEREKTCLVCDRCGGMVYLKEDNNV